MLLINSGSPHDIQRVKRADSSQETQTSYVDTSVYFPEYERARLEEECAELILGGQISTERTLGVIRATERFMATGGRVPSSIRPQVLNLVRVLSGVQDPDSMPTSTRAPQGNEQRSSQESSFNLKSPIRTHREITVEVARAIAGRIIAGESEATIQSSYSWYRRYMRNRILRIARTGEAAN